MLGPQDEQLAGHLDKVVGAHRPGLAKWTWQLGSTVFTVSWDAMSNAILLADIETIRTDLRGKGHAHRVMMRLLEYADEQKLDVILSIRPFGDPKNAMTGGHLESWYARLGFFEDADQPGYYRRKPGTEYTPTQPGEILVG